MVSRRVVIYLVVVLTLFGLVMIASASVVNAARDFSDKWYYLKLQTLWTLIGFTSFIFFSYYPHQKLMGLSKPIMFGTVILLLLVLIPGIGSKLLGARRWINIGFASIQPTEIAKLSAAIYLSKLLSEKRPQIGKFFLTLAGLCGLVMLEPDLGTTLVILGMGMFLYFASSVKIAHVLIIVPVVLLTGFALIFLSPYRRARLTTFFNYSRDPLGASYQIRQALLGIGSGGITGLGFGQSRQKYEFLPEATTDSIFAIVGEELGLIGGIVVVAAFLYLISTGFQISLSVADPFSAHLALSISLILGLQAFINLSAIIALLPLTGIPLPFISYGGSSLVIMLSAAGILANIASKSKHVR